MTQSSFWPHRGGRRGAPLVGFALLVAGCVGGGTIDDSPGGQSSTGGTSANGGESPGTGGDGAGPTTDGGSNVGGDPSGAGGQGGDPGVCLQATEPCADPSECCEGFTCGNTTLGQVCCGMDNAPCATANGEDCCGDLLCVAGQCLAAGAYPNFQAPFPCDESWTYSHHDMEVRRALDFVNDNGATDARPALAAAAGVATQHYEAGGAGNYIVVEHGGGWKTYYFHLQAFSVGDGTAVAQGQEVGLIGSTGASSGPHLHFEELLNGQGMDIVINGQALAPYPGSYFEQSIVSENGCPP